MKELLLLALWWACKKLADLLDDATYEITQRLRRVSDWADEKADTL